MNISTVLSIVGKLTMCFVRRNEIFAMWVWYPPPWSIHPICCCTTLFLSTHSWNETITTTKIAWMCLSREVVLGYFEDCSYLEPIGLRNHTKLLSKDHINWYDSTKTSCTTLLLSTHSRNETITTTKIAWKWLSWEVVLGDFEDWSYLEPIGLRNPTKLLSKDHMNWYNSTKKPILKISMRNLSIQGLYDPWDLIDLDFLLIWKLPFIAHWYVDCSWLVAATLRNLAKNIFGEIWIL